MGARLALCPYPGDAGGKAVLELLAGGILCPGVLAELQLLCHCHLHLRLAQQAEGQWAWARLA